MDEPLDQLLTIKEVVALTRVSKSTIYRRMREGRFPKPVRIPPRTTRWRESAIRAWLHGLNDSDVDLVRLPELMAYC